MAFYLESYERAAEFQPDRFNPVALAGSGHVKVVLACLESGQFIPVHSPAADLVLTVLEGRGTVVAGGREESVAPGCVVHVPAGEPRGIRAETRLVALHVVAPPPTAGDHQGVMEGIRRGKYRP